MSVMHFPGILDKWQRCRACTALQVERHWLSPDDSAGALQLLITSSLFWAGADHRTAQAWARPRGYLGHKDHTRSSVYASAAFTGTNGRHLCCRTSLMDAFTRVSHVCPQLRLLTGLSCYCVPFMLVWMYLGTVL